MDALTFATTWPYGANTLSLPAVDANATVIDNPAHATADSRPIVVDLRPRCTTNPSNADPVQPIPIPGAFPFPVNQYAWRQSVPWFLFPEKSIPFDVIVPNPLQDIDESKSDLPSHFALLSADYATHPWSTGPPPASAPPPCKTAALILRHLVQGGWTIRTVFVATSSFLASIPSSPESAIRLPFDPSPIITESASLVLKTQPARPLRICDLGCGAGRDLAFLLHTYPSSLIAHATAVDNWKGSIDRVTQVASMLGFTARLAAVRAECRAMGKVKYFGGNDATGRGKLQDDQFDWVILHRFLPPRSFARTLHSLVAPGGFVLICTFVLPTPEATLAEWVNMHESPSSFANLLTPGELTRDLDVQGNVMTGKMPDAQVCASQRVVAGFGWGFNEQGGYRVIKEEVVQIADGRTLLWFVAQKVATGNGFQRVERPESE
ncbi:hypothetical protein BCR44DRAFT_36543 [Catenaria anguillulae PL171]|uniref:Methyltransferase domain-containing protein n=1 Tax=Catenaria anguillulae PL171 TaxID=765915 RepID=A0A1Y2I375_9FUNG|nr:hypothetical protein BCR44DRAFT_36543 [Catenaria anguillulae PL171]